MPINPDSSTADEALLAAAVSGNLYAVRRALQAGAKLDAKNADGFTAVCISAERGHTSVLEVLCDAGLDAGQKGSGGWTPLMWAARNGHLECVTALCRRAQPTGGGAGSSAGVDMDAVNDNGSTALMVAATCGHAAIIAILAEAGANLHVATAHNASTALHLAASCGNWAAAEQLVQLDDSKVLLSAATVHGATALHLAAHAASDTVIRALLEANADVQAKDRHRCTPLHYAMRAGDERCVTMLLAAGAGAVPTGSVAYGGAAGDAGAANGAVGAPKAWPDGGTTAGVPAPASLYEPPPAATVGLSASSKLAAARRLVAARHRTHPTSPSALGTGERALSPQRYGAAAGSGHMASQAPSVTPLASLRSPTQPPQPAALQTASPSARTTGIVVLSPAAGQSPGYTHGISAARHDPGSAFAPSIDGRAARAPGDVERLRVEVGEQKRGLARALSQIDELRAKTDGIARDMRSLDARPPALPLGHRGSPDASLTSLLASAASGAPTTVSELASAVAAAASAAFQEQQQKLIGRVVALEEATQQQAGLLNEVEENSRRASIAAAALNAEAHLRGEKNAANVARDDAAAAADDGRRPDGSSASTLDSLLQRMDEAEGRLEAMHRELQAATADSKKAAGLASLASSSTAMGKPPEAVESLRTEMRTLVRQELGTQLVEAFTGDLEPQLRTQVSDIVSDMARAELKKETQFAVQQNLEAAVQRAVTSAVQPRVLTAAGKDGGALQFAELQAQQDSAAQLQLEQQRRHNQDITELQRAMRVQQQSVESLQRELAGIHARSSPSPSPSSRYTVADEVGGTGSGPSPTDGKSPTSAGDMHSRHAGGVADVVASSSRAVVNLRHDLDTLRDALTHQVTMLSERQSDADRASAELRISIPRINVSLESHASSIRHLEDELAALSSAQRTVSAAASEASASAQAAYALGDTARERAAEAGALAREAAAVAAQAALLRDGDAVDSASRDLDGTGGDGAALGGGVSPLDAAVTAAGASQSVRLSLELDALRLALSEAHQTLSEHTVRLATIEATDDAAGASKRRSGSLALAASEGRSCAPGGRHGGASGAMSQPGHGFAAAELVTSEPWRGLGLSVPTTVPEADGSGPAGAATTAGTGTGMDGGAAGGTVALSERPHLSGLATAPSLARRESSHSGRNSPRPIMRESRETGTASPVPGSEKGDGTKGGKWDIKKLAEEIEKSAGGDFTQWLIVMHEQVAIANEEERSLLAKQRRLREDGMESQVSGAKMVTYQQQQVRANKRLQRQIDEARSRVEEVRGLVRTALAHAFVTQLQGRITSRIKHQFIRWAINAGLAVIEEGTVDEHGGASPEVPSDISSDALPERHVPGENASGSHSSGTTVFITGQTPSMELLSRHAPALQRLGLSPNPPSRRASGGAARSEGGAEGKGRASFSSPLGAAAPPTWARSGAFASTPPEALQRSSSLAGPPSSAGGASASLSRSHGKTSLGRANSFGRRRTGLGAGHEPEEVLAERGTGSYLEYRIKWKGFASSQSVTWELGSQVKALNGFEEALARFRDGGDSRTQSGGSRP
jgi:ankyrin repeat protein